MTKYKVTKETLLVDVINQLISLWSYAMGYFNRLLWYEFQKLIGSKT